MLEIRTTNTSIKALIRTDSGLTARLTIITLQTKNMPTIAPIFLLSWCSMFLETGPSVSSSKLLLVCLTLYIRNRHFHAFIVIRNWKCRKSGKSGKFELKCRESHKSILRAFARMRAKKNQQIWTPDLLWEKSCSSNWEKLLRFEARGREFGFEITRTIYLQSERSEQFMKQNAELTYSWRFLRSILIEHIYVIKIPKCNSVTCWKS